jgi:uncharacterized protein (DUF2132 family)
MRIGETLTMNAKVSLEGVTLKAMLTELVDEYGWEGMGDRISIKCFLLDPSMGSSLTFLRKTPWARTKVEHLYLLVQQDKAERRASTDDHPGAGVGEDHLTGGLGQGSAAFGDIGRAADGNGEGIAPALDVGRGEGFLAGL